MAVPKYDTLFTPVLRLLADGKDWRAADIEAAIAREFAVTDAERAAPSAGAQPQKRLTHELSHAKARLTMAKLIESPRAKVHRITDRGRQHLQNGPHPTIEADLRRMPGYSFGR
jgi:restriction endonuclease Mrr